ncbi:hypothetical protein CW696_01500, partial [ANME-2 cluster archaeon]
SGSLTPVVNDGTVTINVCGPSDPIVSIVPTPTTVCVGDDFDVYIEVNPNGNTLQMAQVDLAFDSSLVGMTVADGGMFGMFDAGTQSGNTVTDITGVDAGVSITGNLAVLHMHANSAGTFTLDLSDVSIGDASGSLTPVVNDGTVTINVRDRDPRPDITAPTHGTTIDGTVTVSANDLSGEGDIEYCRFEYAGTPSGPSGVICNDTNEADGWSCDWDTTTVPDEQNYIIRATMGDTAGHTGTDQITVYVHNPCACDFCLELNEGLNFVSVPKTLIDSPRNAVDVFNLSLIDGEFCLYYDASECPGHRWKSNYDVNVLQCQGYWVNKSKAETICLNFNPAASPREQELYEGWNMIGHIDVTGMPIYDGTDADFGSITGLENPDDVKLYMSLCGWNGGFECYPTGSLTHVYPGDAYWILMKQDATMYGQP